MEALDAVREHEGDARLAGDEEKLDQIAAIARGIPRREAEDLVKASRLQNVENLSSDVQAIAEVSLAEERTTEAHDFDALFREAGEPFPEDFAAKLRAQLE